MKADWIRFTPTNAVNRKQRVHPVSQREGQKYEYARDQANGIVHRHKTSLGRRAVSWTGTAHQIGVEQGNDNEGQQGGDHSA